MSKEEAIKMILKHNNEVDHFLNVILPRLMNVESSESKITFAQWIKANELFDKQDFYNKGMKILEECQANGFDVRMDMQKEKLVGLGIR